MAELSGAVLQFDVASDGQVAAKRPPVVETGGTAPNAIAVSPDGRSVYVTNSNVFTRAETAPHEVRVVLQAIDTRPSARVVRVRD